MSACPECGCSPHLPDLCDTELCDCSDIAVRLDEYEIGPNGITYWSKGWTRAAKEAARLRMDEETEAST